MKAQTLFLTAFFSLPGVALAQSDNSLPSDVGPPETDMWQEHHDAIIRHLGEPPPEIDDTPADPRDFEDMEREANPMGGPENYPGSGEGELPPKEEDNGGGESSDE